MNKVYLKYSFLFILFLLPVFFVKLYYDNKINNLNKIIISSENTIKLKDDVFIKKTVEIQDLKNSLDKSNSEIKKLIATANQLKSDLVYANNISAKIKKVSGNLPAKQSQEQEVGAKLPITRKVVSFSGNLKNFYINGWTKTDPAESFLNIEQIKPIQLSVGIIKNKNNVYSTVVTTTDDVDIFVNTATIDLKINEHWYNKIYISANVGFYDNANSIGISYKFNDRIIIGAMCTVSNMKNCSMSTMYKVIR